MYSSPYQAKYSECLADTIVEIMLKCGVLHRAADVTNCNKCIAVCKTAMFTLPADQYIV